jgi:hypothetical protein
MNAVLILESLLQGHNVAVTSQMVHDLDFPPHIFNILSGAAAAR